MQSFARSEKWTNDNRSRRVFGRIANLNYRDGVANPPVCGELSIRPQQRAADTTRGSEIAIDSR